MNLEDDTADQLGISAVIINDLKQRRQRDYDFDWNRALQTNGDTGIKLQYTHCRLHSLMKKQGEQIEGFTEAEIKDFNSFKGVLEDEDARNLLKVIQQYEAAIESTTATLEPCVLVNYLFNLCNSCSKALKRVSVKNETNIQLREEKLILFKQSQLVLQQGMRILGLRPLNEM